MIPNWFVKIITYTILRAETFIGFKIKRVAINSHIEDFGFWIVVNSIFSNKIGILRLPNTGIKPDKQYWPFCSSLLFFFLPFYFLFHISKKNNTDLIITVINFTGAGVPSMLYKICIKNKGYFGDLHPSILS